MEAAAGDWREQADKAGDFSYSSLSGEAFSEEDDKHVFGVFRRLPASPEGRQTGALALWLDAEVLRDTLAGERGIKSFVSDGEVIIAATESEDMGESPARASRGGRSQSCTPWSGITIPCSASLPLRFSSALRSWLSWVRQPIS